MAFKMTRFFFTIMVNSNTRKFSKRQLTWFRKYKNITWVSQTEKIDEIKKIINS